MAVYKDDSTGNWYFRVYATDPETKQRRQYKRMGYELKRDAIEAESIFLSEFKTKKILHSNIRMGVAIEGYFQYLETRVKLTTLSGYIYQINKHITPYFEKVQLRKVSRMLIDNWYETILDKDLSANYKNKLLTRLKSLFKYIEQEYNYHIGYIHNLPPFQKKPNELKKQVTIYDEKQFKLLINNAENDLERAMFKTLFLSGLRIGELRGLKWSDVDLKNRTIDVKRQITSKVKGQPSLTMTPKSESSIRTIHISNNLLSELKNWKSNRSKRRGFSEEWQVFGDYGTVSENTIRRLLKKGTKRANLPHITPHQLRHSYVTLLYNKGVAPEVIKEQLGHSSIQVTLDVYNHITSLQKQQAIDKAFED